MRCGKSEEVAHLASAAARAEAGAGLQAWRQALEAGVSETGSTVHYVDGGMDTGPVILQGKVPVLPGDTAESLHERILEEEHRIYPEAIRMVARLEAK